MDKVSAAVRSSSAASKATMSRREWVQHALGFSGGELAYFRHENGTVRSPRDACAVAPDAVHELDDGACHGLPPQARGLLRAGVQ